MLYLTRKIGESVIINDDIEVTVHDGILTLAAETKSEESDESGRVLRRERRYGKYARSLNVGTEVDEESVSAEYRDGVLTITIPKAAKVLPRKIAVDAK